MGLMSAAAVDMARFYGFPAMTAGVTADANQPGPEAVLEKIISTIPAVMAGADIIVGYGEIESDQALILEQVLVDNEIGHFIQRLFEGIDGKPQNELFDDIAQVGPSGHFLKCRSTRAAARSGEFFHPGLLSRQTYETWINQGKPDIYANARQKVRDILAKPLVDPLPEEIDRQLDKILADADRELA
jgi:trimethylamine--corrinoid protein Co-methyltransferase